MCCGFVEVNFVEVATFAYAVLCILGEHATLSHVVHILEQQQQQQGIFSGRRKGGWESSRT